MAHDQATESAQFGEQATNDYVLTSSATPSINSDKFGSFKFTALAVAVTNVAVTGTPVDMQPLVVRILDAGVAKAITWGSQFENVGGTMPTITVAGKRHTIRFIYDSTTSKWGCVSAVVES